MNLNVKAELFFLNSAPIGQCPAPNRTIKTSVSCSFSAEKELSLIITGLENLAQNPLTSLGGKKLGLLSNPASTDTKYNHAFDIIQKIYPGQIKALFSPQHGFYAEKQDNMIESDHFVKPGSGIPVFSLYSSTRFPLKKMFDLIDVLIIDIQDVGTRVYTFIYTISYCMEAAKKYGKKIIILDRPNPLGGARIEGNVLEKEYASFVGRFPIPMRHGLTAGEISHLFNVYFNIGCDLQIIPMKNWERNMLFKDTLLPYVPPSPNLPTEASVFVYPGQVIFEGTNISEGRGTALPFEQFGAPFFKTDLILNAVKNKIKGAVLRPVCFQPTSGKWQNKTCQGFHIHITDPLLFAPYKTSLLLLQQIIKYHKENFQWKQPPYEYEYKKKPIDLILGSKSLRKKLANLKDINAIEASWQASLCEFKETSKRFYIYE
ncbi:MAG: DUF1343 domain-containing protein [Desulfobacteraceae bacterium]